MFVGCFCEYFWFVVGCLMVGIDIVVFVDWVLCFGVVVVEKCDWFIEFDLVIGDVDYGVNMDRGMSVVGEKFVVGIFVMVDELLKMVGMMFVSLVGGVSGLFYGIFFFCMGMVVGVVFEFDGLVFVVVLCVGFDGIVVCGKVEVGDKIMFDVMVFVVDVFDVVFVVDFFVVDVV